MPTNIIPQSEIPDEISVIATNRIRDCFRIAEAHTDRPFNFEGVKFFNRSTTAGYVIPDTNNIVYLNLELFKKNRQEFISKIIPHEVAHIVAHVIHPESRHQPHGVAWKVVMRRVFGLTPERCHRMETGGVGKSKKQFCYICACKKHFISPLIHKKITEHGKKFSCKKCKKNIVFLKEC